MEAVTYTNIVSGFAGCGLCSTFGDGIFKPVIKPTDVSNRPANEICEPA